MKTIIQLLIILVICINTNAQEGEKEYYDSGELKSISVINKKSLVNDAKYYYKNGNLQATGEWKGTYTLAGSIRWEKIGDWEFYYENGDLAKSGSYYDDKNHGEWKYYSDEGKLVRKENYDLSGDLYGVSSVYYENGQIARELNFSDNKPHGEDKFYYENGQIHKIVIWDKNKLMSIISFYDVNGNALDQSGFKDGNGTINEYDIEGKLIGKTKVVDGVPQEE